MSIHATLAVLLLGLPAQERSSPTPDARALDGRRAQARALERELRGDDDPLRRVAFADWLVRAGLLGEALEQLDRVLEADPDQREARALIATIPVALPDPVRADDDGSGVDALFAKTARAGPAVREHAAQRLAAAPEIPGLHARLLKELVHQDPRRRTFATLALRRVLPGREVRPLLGRAILDSSEAVRRGAGLALRDAGDPAVIVPAVRALGSRNATVRRHAADALGTMGYPAAVAPLVTHLFALQSGSAPGAYGASGPPRAHVFVGRQIAYVGDFDVEVAQFQAAADPKINVLTEGAALEGSVIGVHSVVARRERAAVRRALTRLTGADPGDTTDAWRRWWEEHGDEWQAGIDPPGPSSSPSSPGG